MNPLKLTFMIGMCLLFFGVACASDQNIEVEIFTDSSHPVHAVQTSDLEIHYYHLDAPAVIQDQIKNAIKNLTLNQHTDSDDEFIKKSKTVFDQYRQPLIESYHGLKLANQYGLTEYPAVVFDHGRAVAFSNDLDFAVTEYRLWLEQK